MNEITIDMGCVCPRDVKKMLVQRARSVYWKKWAARHEYEELKEGAWLEPGIALLRKKVKENGLKSIAMWQGRSSWKEVGRNRDYGRMLSMSCMPIGGRHRKAQAAPLSRMA